MKTPKRAKGPASMVADKLAEKLDKYGAPPIKLSPHEQQVLKCLKAGSQTRPYWAARYIFLNSVAPNPAWRVRRVSILPLLRAEYVTETRINFDRVELAITPAGIKALEGRAS